MYPSKLLTLDITKMVKYIKTVTLLYTQKQGSDNIVGCQHRDQFRIYEP